MRVVRKSEIRLGALLLVIFLQLQGAWANPVNVRDSMALIALYNATEGVNWTNQWDFNQPIDNWYGVTTNQVGDVVQLDLSSNGLRGSLPNQIGLLSALKVLKLEFNQISGPIPDGIGILFNLEQLVAFNNNLEGNLPDTLVNLRLLRRISLSNNNFSGTLPSRIGQMDSLTMLVMDRNALEGPLPESIGGCENLEILALNDNFISGSLPESVGQLKNLRELLLFNNHLTGSLPASMVQMNSLEILWMQSNGLTGEVPPFSLANLRSLRLNNNAISGLPDLSNNPFGIGFPDGLSVELNQLSFDDILMNRALIGTARFSYAPQDTLGTFATYYANEGDRLQILLPFDDTVTTSGYRWFQDGDLYQFTQENVFIINNIQKSDAGIYHAEIGNDIIGDLILRTTPFEIIVRDSLDCNGEMGQSCFSAPIFCEPDEADLFCGTLPVAPDIMVCRDIGFSAETRWIGWIADTSEMTLEVLPFSCSDIDAGVQWEVYLNCSGRQLIYCQDTCDAENREIRLTGLIKGEDYLLALRSCSGQCRFQIRTSSAGTAQPLILAGPISGPDTICGIGGSLELELENAQGVIQEFVWTINDDTISTPRPNLSYDVDEAVLLEICVFGVSACDTSNSICKLVPVFPDVSIENVAIDVVRNDSFYVVEFQVEGGVGTIVFDSLRGAFNAVTRTFVSEPIRCGQPFEVMVTDENGCSDFIEGVEVCNCSSEAGRIDDEVIEACLEDVIRVSPAMGVQLDSNDASGYVLLDQQDFDENEILAESPNGRFLFLPGILQPDRVYYAFFVVGNEDGNTIDYADPCLDFSGPQPIIFYSYPKANAGEDEVYCQNTFTLRARRSRSGSTGLWMQVGGPNAVVGQPMEPVTDVQVAVNATYTFSWTETFNDCSSSDTVVVEVLPELNGNISGPDSICDGQVAMLEVIGDFDTYLWENGDTASFREITSPGNYCVDITKDGLCTQRICKLVRDAIVMNPEILGDTRICEGEETMLQVIPTFDTYSWNTGDSTFFITADTAGTYCITVTDFKGCRATDCVVVVEDDAREAFISDTLCFGESLEVFDTVLTTTGSFILRENDGEGCDSVVKVDLFVYPEIFISDSLIILDDGSSNGSVSVNIRGGSPPYDYLWNTGATIPFVNNLPGDIYTLTVTDSKGCIQEFSFDLRQPNSVEDHLEGPWRLHPNPVSKGGQLLIVAQSADDLGDIHVRAYSSDGRVVIDEKLQGVTSTNSGFLPIEGIDEGVYLLHVSDATMGRSHILTFIVQ